MARRAVFLDRDGTIIRDTEYLRDPDQVELLPGAARAIRRLNDAGWMTVVVTNQSGIARGLLTEQDYERVRMRLDRILADAAGAKIDATYHCPHHPDFGGRCECRKPGLKLYTDAAREHDIDLAASWYVGDRIRDVAPGDHFGGRSVMLAADSTPDADHAAARAGNRTTAGSLAQAVDMILGTSERPARKRVAVLASGGGSNLQAILDHLAFLDSRAAAEVVLVASDRAQAGALAKARAANIDAVVLRDRDPRSTEILDLLAARDIEIVALAGYLRLIPPSVVDRYGDRMLNVHPALLPKHGGAGMYGLRVHQAVINAKETASGATVHLVTHEYDTGPVLAQWPVAVLPGDDAPTLAARVLVAEHALYPRVLEAVAAGESGRFPLRPPAGYAPAITPEEIRRDITAAWSS